MLKLLERSVAVADQRLVLLAPPETQLPPVFSNIDIDCDRHEQLVREVQRFRGSIYLEDGAVERSQLSPDGLHRTPEDEKSWHLLMLNGEGRVSACTWYRQHDNKVYFDRLRLRHCPLATLHSWRDKLWKAVETEIACARRDGIHYAEVGGWAVSKESRFTPEALVLALAAYSLGRIGGGTLGITTATVRHHSAAILKRLGGRSLEVDGFTVPPYYDPNYRCVMEILRFDSREPSRQFNHLVGLLCEKLTQVLLIARPCWPMPAALQAMSRQSLSLSVA
jgi:hypothetical protein